MRLRGGWHAEMEGLMFYKINFASLVDNPRSQEDFSSFIRAQRPADGEQVSRMNSLKLPVILPVPLID